jgi:signal transduction histidine kinase/CheY-like chemotaxis protein
MSGDVLIVDDEPNYRRTIKYHLVTDKESYRFVEAESPAEGIVKLQANPDLRVVLLDLGFPGAASKATDLLEFAARRPSYYRIIILTGNEPLLSADQAKRYPVFTYLPKAEHERQALRFTVDQAFKDLERVELGEKIRAIQHVQKQISENDSLEETFNIICNAVLATTEGYTCHIRVFDVNRDDYHITGFAGPDDSLRSIFERPKEKGQFFSGRVVDIGKPVSYADLQSLPEFQMFAAETTAERPPSEAEDLYWRTVSSAYIVPIKTRVFGSEIVDAVLNVSCQQKSFFANDEKQALVDEFATLAELALKKHWLNLQRRRIHCDYQRIGGMLDEISDRLEHDNALEEIYDVVTKTVDKLVHPEVITIFRRDSWTGRIKAVYERGGEREDLSSESYGLGQSLTGMVFKTGETIHLPDPDDPSSKKPMRDDRFKRENPDGFMTHAPSRSLEHYLAAPIRIGKDVVGVLRVINKKSRYYKKDDMRLLESGFGTDCRYLVDIAAHLLAVTIRLAESLRGSRQRLKLVETVGAASRLINGAHSVEDLLIIATEQMADVMQAQVAMLFLKEDENRIVLKRTYGMAMIDASYELGEGGTGQVVVDRQPILIDHVSANDGKYDDEIRKALPDRADGRPGLIETLIIAPIMNKDTVVGVMKVINRRGDLPGYTEDDLKLFASFADYFAVALENATLFDRANEEVIVRKRNAALSTLISAVANEIRNTSGLVPGTVDGLRKQLGTANEGVTRRLNLIERVAVQATDFANELAGFALSKRGERAVVNINDVVRITIGELQKDPKYQNSPTVRLDQSLSAAPLHCFIYANPFAQVIRNLVINAFQALETSRDGCITVSTFAEGADAVLLVEDDGPGVPVDYEEKIFEPDFTTKPNGNGIALWLVRVQLEQVNGRIELQSKDGKGARFAVMIPREETTGEQRDADASPDR